MMDRLCKSSIEQAGLRIDAGPLRMEVYEYKEHKVITCCLFPRNTAKTENYTMS